MRSGRVSPPGVDETLKNFDLMRRSDIVHFGAFSTEPLGGMSGTLG